MKVETGEGAAEFTYQDPFPLEVDCNHCSNKAELIFVAHELNRTESSKADQFICQKYRNDPNGEGFWLHDAMCAANYMCRKCFKITAIWNQA